MGSREGLNSFFAREREREEIDLRSEEGRKKMIPRRRRVDELSSVQ